VYNTACDTKKTHFDPHDFHQNSRGKYPQNLPLKMPPKSHFSLTFQQLYGIIFLNVI